MADMSKAARAYKQFRGMDPREVVSVPLPDKPVKSWHMGDVEGIMYKTERDGETQRYMHKFKGDAGPSLVVQDDGKQLYLTGGDYHVTERGIEDNMATFKKNPLMLVANPHKRGTKAKSVKEPKKMAVHRRRKTATKRRHSSGAKVIVVRSNPVSPLAMFAKPKRRRKTYRRNPVVRAAPVRHRGRRRYKRNPIGIGGKGDIDLIGLLFAASFQGAGGVATSILYAALPVPENLKSGPFAGFVKASIGVAAGMVIAKFVNKKVGQLFAEGAITIAAYDTIKGYVPSTVPMGEFLPRGGMGEFLPRGGGMGYVSASALSPDVMAY